ncbi:hypothetical protein HYFRA_00011117 [Hymenoscyphus fraxineus]|uniref:Uncharacterized protein n=1 Tax=Hymenoscyphus fraxineus TaxID=746836 RepID=A0A9N9L651_9HELO|nr:hypothetical protein HYFRA_00011117 [Hymenoscyphus fraxineus]
MAVNPLQPPQFAGKPPTQQPESRVEVIQALPKRTNEHSPKGRAAGVWPGAVVNLGHSCMAKSTSENRSLLTGRKNAQHTIKSLQRLAKCQNELPLRAPSPIAKEQAFDILTHRVRLIIPELGQSCIVDHDDGLKKQAEIRTPEKVEI